MAYPNWLYQKHVLFEIETPHTQYNTSPHPQQYIIKRLLLSYCLSVIFAMS